MTFDRSTLAHVAGLARLSLSDEEADELAADLERILAAFHALRDVEAEAPEADAPGPLRADRVHPAPEAERERIVEAFTTRDGRHLKAVRGL